MLAVLRWLIHPVFRRIGVGSTWKRNLLTINESRKSLGTPTISKERQRYEEWLPREKEANPAGSTHHASCKTSGGIDSRRSGLGYLVNRTTEDHEVIALKLQTCHPNFEPQLCSKAFIIDEPSFHKIRPLPTNCDAPNGGSWSQRWHFSFAVDLGHPSDRPPCPLMLQSTRETYHTTTLISSLTI